MTVLVSKPAINIREQLTELKAQQGYEERQFHFDNLVTNGTFDTDTSGWTALDSTLSVSSGELVITATTNGIAYANQSMSVEVGRQYVVSVDHKHGNISQDLLIGSTVGGSDLYNGPTLAADTTETITVVAITTTLSIRIRVFSTTTGQFGGADNISVYTSDGTDVAFTMPKSWKPLHVYEDGLLQREGSVHDYEVVYDGFDYFVKPTVTPSPTTQTCVIGVRA